MVQEALEAYERCVRRYPGVQLSSEDFQSRIDAILSSQISASGDFSAEMLAQIHHEDLFLALACSQKDRVAWEHFAEEYLPMLRHFAAQACGNDSDGEDLAQEIFTKLLNDHTRLAGYNGRGSLAGWLRVTVSHAAIDRFRRSRKQVPLEELEENAESAVLSVPAKNIEAALDNSRWGEIISRIANGKISSLSPRDRLILGLHYLNGVPLKLIGRQFGIHEATVSRWIDRLRSDIRNQVDRELRKKHGLRTNEIRSLWKQINEASVVNPIAKTMSEAAAGDAAGMDDEVQNKSARQAE